MIRVLTTYYNSPHYSVRMIDSLQMQTFKDWKCYITNDMSTDGSEQQIEYLINGDPRFELINNTEKMWQTGNYYQVVHKEEVDDKDICITVDGDDWLPDANVFKRVLSYYADGKTLMTFGQFEYYEGYGKTKPGFCRKPDLNNVRTSPWTSTHLRTFKAGLFRKVKKEDLMFEARSDGLGFIDMAGDVVCFSPCIEMAGEDRIKYVNDINYVYNIETPLNEFKTGLSHSHECVRIAASKPKYERIL